MMSLISLCITDTNKDSIPKNNSSMKTLSNVFSLLILGAFDLLTSVPFACVFP